MKNEMLWLSQAQIAQVFGRERSVITKHIRNIFAEGELDEKSNVQNLHIANSDKPVAFYSLDAILAVGYRVKSAQAPQFRQWATTVLHEYLQKGFAMNDDFLKNMGGGLYWKELLERIRDIRASEKVMYRQVLKLKAVRQEPLYMCDWLETLDKFTGDFGLGVLEGTGSVSHADAVEKAHREYDTYRAQLTDELNDVEKAYLDTLREMQKALKVMG